LSTFVFIVGSIGLIGYSWSALRRPGSHGFYRFFAFEALLLLIIINLEYWFVDPFANLQIISWFLLIASIYLATQGFYYLHKRGQYQIGIDSTNRLVEEGLYRIIRHPLYTSLLVFGWGAFLKHVSTHTIILVLLVTLFLALTAKVEEKELLEKFGDDYRSYMKVTSMFIPYLF